MGINVLYIEDSDSDHKKILKAISDFDGKSTVELKRLSTPADIRNVRNFDFDIILADVLFKRGEAQEDQLSDILRHVADRSNREGLGRSLPVIAYTSGPEDTLSDTFDKREHRNYSGEVAIG